MKTKISIILILLFCFQINAQSTFKEGYYVSNSKDTVVGLIKDYDWNDNPTEILFKSNEIASEKILLPEDILSFEINNKVRYKSAKVDIDVSKDGIANLRMDKLPKYENKHLFLKVLEEGNVNLYRFSNSINTRFFYKTPENPIEMLIYKEYLTASNKMGKNNNFRQQLLNKLSCKDISRSAFTTLKYREGELKKIIRNYNKCVGESTFSYEKDKSNQSFFVSVRPGLQLASLTTKIRDNILTEFDSELSFRLGVELEYILPFKSRKWSFIVEPSFQSYSSRKETPLLNNASFRRVEYTSIEVPFGIRYYHSLNPENQIFINAGGTFDYSFDDSKISGNVGSLFFIDSSLNPFIGFGYKYNNKFSFELRYQTARNLIKKYSQRSSNFSSSSFIIGYRIN